MRRSYIALATPGRERYGPLAADHAWNLAPGTCRRWLAQGALPSAVVVGENELRGDYVEASRPHEKDGVVTLEVTSETGEHFELCREEWS
jgi:hypothetical protein